MNRIRAIGMLLAGVSLMPIVARAELTIIYDSGVTQPLAPFFTVFGEAVPAAPVHRPSGEIENLGAAELSRLLPIRSPGLTPGPVTRRPLSLPYSLPNGFPSKGTLPRPVFLIGADDRSRAWLATHRDRLKSIGAVGMLVQAESVGDLEAIARIADGLAILPASASDITQVLGIQHVPVLISSLGIEQ